MAGGSDVLKRMQRLFLDMGPSGIKHIPTVFHYFDKDGSQTVNPEEFTRGMSTLDIEVSEEEVKELFRLLDRDGSGKIDVREFTKALEPKMNDKRTELVKKCFKVMDQNGDGVISVEDFKRTHRGDELAIKHFLQEFEASDDIDSKVTLDEFMCFYSCVSAGFEDDDYFVAEIMDNWAIE